MISNMLNKGLFSDCKNCAEKRKIGADIEETYAGLFKLDISNVAKPVRILLGAPLDK